MKANVFYTKLTSTKLKENIEKQFGTTVNLERYDREQLEDIRNKLRTRIFQYESGSRINDLLTNEMYQKDKAMLELLNTRIKEMLGEDFRKLKNKLDELNEAKKGTRPPKNVIKAKGAKADKDYDGDGKVETPKDEVWGSRAKAAAKAGKPFGKEQSVKEATKTVSAKSYGADYNADDEDDNDNTAHNKRKPEDKKPKFDTSALQAVSKSRSPTTPPKGRVHKMGEAKDEAKEKCNHTPKGEKCPVHGLKECGMYESEKKPSAGLSKKQKSDVAKKARAGKDIGKKGKAFKDVEAAAKKGGARDPKAAAAMWKNVKRENVENFKQNVRLVNESLVRLLKEDEEQKAKAITAASDIVNDYTSWMQRVGQYQTKALIELGDQIRAEFGAAEAETFKQTVGPALTTTLETLTAQREAVSNAVAVLAGEATTSTPMGMEPAAGEVGPETPDMEPSSPDQMNASDEFAASDAAAGGPEAAGREMRESREQRRARKLAEQHSIISKLAK